MQPSENNIQIIRTAPFEDCKTNPARVSPLTGVIEINALVFDYLPKEVQEFVIEHEKAHYLKQVKDEHLADYYAMLALLQKNKNALYDSVKSVEKIASYDSNRIDAITMAALRIAAINGNKRAVELMGEKFNASGSGSVEKSKKSYWFLAVIVIIVLFLILKKNV